MDAIASNPLPVLNTLWLSFNKISHVGIEKFTKRNWDSLERLHLSANHIGAEGIKCMVTKSWPNMKNLQLYDCNLGDEGMAELVKNDWPSIQDLHLCNFVLIQPTIKLEMTELRFWSRMNGQRFSFFMWVPTLSVRRVLKPSCPISGLLWRK